MPGSMHPLRTPVVRSAFESLAIWIHHVLEGVGDLGPDIAAIGEGRVGAGDLDRRHVRGPQREAVNLRDEGQLANDSQAPSDVMSTTRPIPDRPWARRAEGQR